MLDAQRAGRARFTLMTPHVDRYGSRHTVDRATLSIGPLGLDPQSKRGISVITAVIA